MSSLPLGTVTFLFTDIEGSTRLWDAHPDAMRVALARHDALMRAAIEQHDGHVFKTIGDAFCAAFHTAPDAVNAALDAQQALHTEVWPHPIVIRVRMALHTGTAEVRDNDYFGQPLNRVARLLGAGHGGQVLLSDAAQELSRDTLPPAVSLLSLGEHRLRDLSRPETVFQLLHPSLPSDSPPLKSLDNPTLPNNLPLQLTSFIGREKAMQEIQSLLTGTRLLTLTGSGGCGKTRLSLQVAAEVLEDYPDGVWLAELAPLADAGLVVQTVASVLGVKEQAGQPLHQTLSDSLKSKRLLLLLDNCEHLIAACAQLTAALMRSCTNVKFLATSREALGLPGEQTYRVPSLSLPDPKQPSSPESVSQYEAVRLFIERALLVKPDFVVTHPNAPALAQVCFRLDGIPLAIELAAARVRSLPVEEINARLDNRFRLLTGGDRAALPRQQTLRALIDWSYDLLGEPERRLLARLSVFAGGWTLEAAEQVGAGESVTGESIEEWEVLDLLTSLVDKSLVIAEEQDGMGRYRMLETVRQYAGERLQANGEAAQVRARHRDTFVALAEKALPQLRGPEQQRWLEQLESEHDNLRAALAWCAEEAVEANAVEANAAGATAGLQLAGALSRFWYVRGHWSEGREHLKWALERERARGGTKERARVLLGAGTLALAQGDFAAARSQVEESLGLYRELADRNGIAEALSQQGYFASLQYDFAAARTLHEESLRLFRELADKNGIATSLGNLSYVASLQGDYGAARTLYQEGLRLYREVGNKSGIAHALHYLGSMANEQEDYEAARTQLEEGLRLYREVGNKSGIAHALHDLGSVATRQGDPVGARTLFEESLRLNRELGNKSGSAWSLITLGGAAYRQGDYAAALTHLEEGLKLHRELADRSGIAYALSELGHLAQNQGDYVTARTRWTEGLHVFRELGDRRGIAFTLITLSDLASQQGDYATARTQLEESLGLYRELDDRRGVTHALEKLAAVVAAEADGMP